MAPGSQRILAVLCLAGCVGAYGQEKTAGDAIRVQTAFVSVPVIVGTLQGGYIAGLKVEDFKLYQDEASQPIAVFAATDESLHVALLLDTSKSTISVLDDIKIGRAHV